MSRVFINIELPKKEKTMFTFGDLLIKRFLLVILSFGLLVTTTRADTYNGSISYGNGLTGANVWNTAELLWKVDNESTPGLWTYEYTFTVGAKDISHVIMSVWKSFTTDSIEQGTSGHCSLGTFGQQGNSNPGIPGNIYGMKCTPSRGSKKFSWSIVTDRGPMWGNFYAKDGKHKGEWVFAYNTEYGSEPPDLTITNGNNGGWVLVPGMNHYEKIVHNFAVDRFKGIRNIIAPEDDTKPEADFKGNHIEVQSEKWVYVLNDSGQQIFRPKAMFPHIEPSLSKDIAPYLEEWKKMTVPQKTVDEANRIAQTALGAKYLEDTQVNMVARRELIAVKDLIATDSPLKYYEGRIKVLFNPEVTDDPKVKRIHTKFTNDPLYGHPIVKSEEIYLPPRSYETAITFSQGRAVRLDSVFMSLETQDVVKAFREGVTRGSIKETLRRISPRMVLGTFFAPDEWRGQFSAYSWESEGFITMNESYINNPYGTDQFPFCADDPLVMDDFDIYRQTNYYKGDYWDKWNIHGRSNGIRGNCYVYLPLSQPRPMTCEDWEHDNWKVKHHNLGDYQWVCPPLQNCKEPDLSWPPDWQLDASFCQDFNTVYTDRGRYLLEDAFYNDLEDCDVALIYAHGGPAWGIPHYQFQSKRDIWTRVHTKGMEGLGKHFLRYLFLASCASMNWHKEEPYYLETEWLNNHVADGIRSIFGTDGEYIGTYFDGLIFFNYYNNGDSVSDSWFNMETHISPNNTPVGIGYGSSGLDALASIVDDRFVKTRPGKGWAAVIALMP